MFALPSILDARSIIISLIIKASRIVAFQLTGMRHDSVESDMRDVIK